MLVRVVSISLALTLLWGTSVLASPLPEMTADEVRAHPDFVEDDYSLSDAYNGGGEAAARIYEWIGYIPVGDQRVYFTSYGEPLTCVSWEVTGEWVPEWVVGAMDRLYDEGHITFYAPGFAFSTPDGTQTTLDARLGKPLVINFWADWCGPCVREMPHFEEVYAEHAGAFDLIAVAVKSARDAEGFFAENGFTFELALDNNGARVYEVRGIPTTLFINTDGTLAEMRVGGMTKEMFEEKLAQILH